MLSPWPGKTTVFLSSVNNLLSIELMIFSKSPPSNWVAPGPPGNKVSPLKSMGLSFTLKHIEPGVCPGVKIVSSLTLPTLITDSSSSISS